LVPFILLLNRVFRPPNVRGRESDAAYSRWEHELGTGLCRDYLEPAGDLRGKTVLDVGCGLGGKTVAYEEGGAALVMGADLSARNVAASAAYARAHGMRRGTFLVADAAALPVDEGAFDTVVANDAMEHFEQPDRALAEMARAARPGGALWIFFTPHFSPLGSHLYDYIYTPWCHLLFTRRQLEGAVRRVLDARMNGQPGEAVAEKTREVMDSYDNDLNHMSVRRFLGIVARARNLRVAYLELRPAKFRALAPLLHVPLIRELFTGFVVCRLEKAA